MFRSPAGEPSTASVRPFDGDGDPNKEPKGLRGGFKYMLLNSAVLTLS
jgi:hypothetical protein